MAFNVVLSPEIEYLMQKDADRLNIPKCRIARGIINLYYKKNLLYKNADGKTTDTIPAYMLDAGIKNPI
jgi:hypothetical protein